jgi:hypothetical protein
MLVVREAPKIENRPPKTRPGEEGKYVILEVLGSIRKRVFGCQQDFSGFGTTPRLCIALQNELTVSQSLRGFL